QKRRLGIRPSHGPRHRRRLWRPHQEGNVRLPFRWRTLPRRRCAQCPWCPAHRHRGPRTQNFPHGRPRSQRQRSRHGRRRRRLPSAFAPRRDPLREHGQWHSPCQSGRRLAPSRIAAVLRRLQRRPRTADRQARHRDRLRRRPQHPDDRPSWFRQDHAGQAHADDPATVHLRRGVGDDEDPQRGRSARPRHAPGWNAPLSLTPPHAISAAGLIGGGVIPRPGEVSLAHNGLLFLDELPEFPRNVLEVLRQPLEDGVVTIARAAMSLTFPARFMLAAAMNPCPCGYFNDKSRECMCPPPMIQRYVSKVSGPLLDRIDIHIEVPAVQYKELRGGAAAEGSAEIRERVMGARHRQHERFKKFGEKIYSNAQMSTRQIRAYCELGADAERLLERAMQQQGLTARAHDRILKVARTIADLEGEVNLTVAHLAEAIQYRTLDRSYWA